MKSDLEIRKWPVRAGRDVLCHCRSSEFYEAGHVTKALEGPDCSRGNEDIAEI
jgi:hypothetical protein